MFCESVLAKFINSQQRAPTELERVTHAIQTWHQVSKPVTGATKALGVPTWPLTATALPACVSEVIGLGQGEGGRKPCNSQETKKLS